jgi:hypothetical protein
VQRAQIRMTVVGGDTRLADVLQTFADAVRAMMLLLQIANCVISGQVFDHLRVALYLTQRMRPAKRP